MITDCYSALFICVADFDVPPTDVELLQISDQIGYMWKGVGIQLGLERYRLENIESNHSKCEAACLQMLLLWKQLNRNVSRRVLDEVICKGTYTMYLSYN